MGKVTRLFGSFLSDGFRALSVFVPIISGSFWICKWLNLMPQLSDISYAWGLLPITIWALVAYIRRFNAYVDHVDAVRPSALSLPTLGITEIANYLLKDSKWGSKKLLEYGLRTLVQADVADEMTRAGAVNDVRYIGTAANGNHAVEIDRSYWRDAFIDGDRIWDARNDFFTDFFRGSTLGENRSYQYGCAPRVDVMRTWPRASAILRLRAFWHYRYVTRRLKGG